MIRTILAHWSPKNLWTRGVVRLHVLCMFWAASPVSPLAKIVLKSHRVILLASTSAARHSQTLPKVGCSGESITMVRTASRFDPVGGGFLRVKLQRHCRTVGPS